MAHPCDYHFYALAQKVLPDHAITIGPRGVWVCVVGREVMSVREWNACVHYAYEPLARFPTTSRGKS